MVDIWVDIGAKSILDQIYRGFALVTLQCCGSTKEEKEKQGKDKAHVSFLFWISLGFLPLFLLDFSFSQLFNKLVTSCEKSTGVSDVLRRRTKSVFFSWTSPSLVTSSNIVQSEEKKMSFSKYYRFVA